MITCLENYTENKNKTKKSFFFLLLFLCFHKMGAILINFRGEGDDEWKNQKIKNVREKRESE